MSVPEGSGGRGADLLGMLPKNGDSAITNDIIMQENEGDEFSSVADDTNRIIRAELISDVGSGISLPAIAEIENLFSGSADATVRVWDLLAKKCIATFTKHESAVTSLALEFDKI